MRNFSNRFIISGVVIIVGVMIAGLMQISSNKEQALEDSSNQKDTTLEQPVIGSEGEVSDVVVEPITDTEQSQTKVFTVVGKNFSFDQSEIRAQKGDTVKIIFKNEEGFHDLVLDEFNAKTSRLSVGESAEIEFVADKTGSFEYYCSVGTHRQMGMKGLLIVE